MNKSNAKTELIKESKDLINKKDISSVAISKCEITYDYKKDGIRVPLKKPYVSTQVTFTIKEEY